MLKRSVCLVLCLFLLSMLFACNTDESVNTTDPSDTAEQNTDAGTPTETPTNKPTDKPSNTDKDEEPEDMNDVTKFNLKKFMHPIWDGEISYAEAAFVRESEKRTVEPIELLYPIEELVSVRSADLKTEYVNGKDYYVDGEGRLCIIEDGDIPILKYEDYFFKLSNSEHQQNNLATKFPAADNYGWGYIRAEIGSGKPGMSEWTLAVTYKHSAELIVNEPTDKSGAYEKLIDKLMAGEDITLVSTGDSITDGWSASGKSSVGIPPYCPPYNTLVDNFMRVTYGAKVIHHNVGVSGSNTNGGVEKLDEICSKDPDLVIIAFGMNDGCSMEPVTYIANINKMVSTIEERCPEACIVVVGTCLPNPEVAWSPGGVSILKYHIEYADHLKEAEASWTNARFADVTTVNLEMLERKVYQDLSGSNSNHPNDYMHRVYAQVILRTMFGDYWQLFK